MTRTYLYVDGENFARRTSEFNRELQGNAERQRQLQECFPSLDGRECGRINASPNNWTSAWLPQPHREALATTQNPTGILYDPEGLYWDPLGLSLALLASSVVSRALNETHVDRAYYFASGSQDKIPQHNKMLHSLGFAAHVYQRVQPESWAKDLKNNENITVVSRPKPMDIFLATQVLEDCFNDNFDCCIFVSGDEDYVPLFQAVRRRGKSVWLVAFERWLAKSQKLRYACDRFVAYDPVLSIRPLPVLAKQEDTNG